MSRKQSILNSQNLTQLIKINSKALEFENNQIQFEIVELQKRNNYTSAYITFKSAKKLIQKQNKRIVKNNIVKDTSELVKYFCNLFDLKYYDKFSVFDSQVDLQYLESQQDFELICKAIYENTVSGLFIYFIRFVTPSIKSFAQAIMQFSSHLKLSFKLNYQKKMLELFLAASYDKNEKYSQGYNFKVICSLCKVTNDEYTNHIIYLSQKLRTIFYNLNASSLFIVRNCINLSHMFDQDFIYNKLREDQDIYESSVETIKEIYSAQILKENPNVSEILALILYLLYRKDKIYENIWNQFNDYNLGNVKKKFKNLEYQNDFCYL